MENAGSGVTLRQWDPSNPSERAFVYSAWLKSYRDRVYEIPRSWYSKIYNAILDRLLLRTPCHVVLAVSVDSPDTYLGFVAYEQQVGGTPTLHYLYVKQIYRPLGNLLVARLLLRSALGEYRRFFYTFRPSNHNLGRYLGGIYRPEYIRKALP